MSWLHRVLLRLIPSHRRAAHGDEIAHVFEKVLEDARRERRSTARLWIAELRGLARFALRERARTPALELRIAWRGLKARGSGALIAGALLAVAIAANTVMFAVADALVLTPTVYRDSKSIVELARVREPMGISRQSVSPKTLDEMRQQTDLFTRVEAYLGTTVFLIGEGVPQLVWTADVTPGMTSLLGVDPTWGRPLIDGDLVVMDAFPVLIGEELARTRFGDPAKAINQRLETTAEPLLVVGVMSRDFNFPSSAQQIWRALDPRGPLARGYAGVFPVARVASGAEPHLAAHVLTERFRSAGKPMARGGPVLSLVPIDESMRLRTKTGVVWLMLGAALCLLATACANIASIEMASAITRARVWAIHIALGASRWTMARIAATEGLLSLAFATMGAIAISYAAIEGVQSWLPPSLALSTVNRFDIDPRALAFMLGISALTWLLTSLPPVLYASRPDAMDLLKRNVGASVSRPGTGMRQSLTTAQIALAVLLLAGGALATRSYVAILSVDKGFDSRNLLQVSLILPPQTLDSQATETRLLDRLRATPGVVAATPAHAPPSEGDSPMELAVRVEGRLEPVTLRITIKRIEPDYFEVLGLRLKEGRPFHTDERDSGIVISDRLASAMRLGSGAAGTRIQLYPGDHWHTITGVVPHVATASELTRSPLDRSFQAYVHRRPPPAPAASTPARPAFATASYGVALLTVRVDAPSRAADVLRVVRAEAPDFASSARAVDDSYATFYSDVLLIKRIATTFGALAFVVALAGVYAVTAYLVAGRRKEIGIRIALGARRSDIRHLVLGASMRMVLIGAALGTAATLVLASSGRAALFGVQPHDPSTHVGIAAAVALAALAATWRPASAACRTDPSMLLRE